MRSWLFAIGALLLRAAFPRISDFTAKPSQCRNVPEEPRIPTERSHRAKTYRHKRARPEAKVGDSRPLPMYRVLSCILRGAAFRQQCRILCCVAAAMSSSVIQRSDSLPSTTFAMLASLNNGVQSMVALQQMLDMTSASLHLKSHTGTNMPNAHSKTSMSILSTISRRESLSRVQTS